MVESVATRVKRILRASIADLIDRVEAAQAESVMKEAIREIEQVIDGARLEASRAAAKRLQAVRHAQMTRDKIADLSKRAKDVLSQSREDLAQAAISRQLDLEAQLVALADAERDKGFKPGGMKTPDCRAENAAATFDRAMKAATGDMPTMAPAEAETGAKLAELEVMLRQKQVAERLAELKAAM